MFDNFAERVNTIPLVAPVNTTTTSVKSPYVKLAEAHRVQFLVFMGVLTSSSTTAPILYVYSASSAASTSAAKTAFRYRISGAIAANTWGTITAATAAAGYTWPIASGSLLGLIEVDPADCLAANAKARYVSLWFVSNAQISAAFIGMIARVDTRYASNVMNPAT